MKGRPPILNTEEEAIHHYIGEYYKERSEDPEIVFDEDRHLELVDSMNKRYQDALKRKPEFNYDQYENYFMECIDFLTKIISKRREKMEQCDLKKQFLKKFNK